MRRGETGFIKATGMNVFEALALAAILIRHPLPRGVLFDMPHVVTGAPEYSALLAKAGFRLDRVIPTASAASIVEALPA